MSRSNTDREKGKGMHGEKEERDKRLRYEWKLDF